MVVAPLRVTLLFNCIQTLASLVVELIKCFGIRHGFLKKQILLNLSLPRELNATISILQFITEKSQIIFSSSVICLSIFIFDVFNTIYWQCLECLICIQLETNNYGAKGKGKVLNTMSQLEPFFLLMAPLVLYFVHFICKATLDLYCRAILYSCIVYGVWCMVRGAWCVLRGAWCVVYSARVP